jgi:HK97 gp10 family phage protein
MGAVTLPQLATIFARASVEIKHARHEILEDASVFFEDRAKSALGTYDFGWPPLAESTIAGKATGDSPLLETGALRDSIQHNVDPMANLTGDAYVGTDLEYAKYQEYGTSKIPARPFLGGAIAQGEAHIPWIVHQALAKLFP